MPCPGWINNPLRPIRLRPCYLSAIHVLAAADLRHKPSGPSAKQTEGAVMGDDDGTFAGCQHWLRA